MNIILFDSRTGNSRTLRLNGKLMVGMLALVVGFCALTAGMAGYWLGERHEGFDSSLTRFFKQDIANNAEGVEQARRAAEEQLTAMSIRMAELQARLMRLDALGERLVEVANLGNGEFDFSSAPALGGPDTGDKEVVYERPGFLLDLDRLAADIQQREQQLDVLDTLLSSRSLQQSTALTGRPVEKGWLSSRFGRRADPFTGRLAWHEGVDFAGKEGANILSAGSGVVTWAGERYGYGLLVEVNHGGGYTTRYAHAKEVKVKVGDIVKKGEVLAIMGSTGRSTGPHVHFEVRLDGKAVNPSRFLVQGPG